MVPLLPSAAPESLLFQEVRVEPEEARSILRPQKDERYGFGFALSPYRGCGHGCRYCYVRDYPNDLHPPGEWGRWSAPKLNAPELLWSQRHRLHNQSVFLASATDPYQPLEREFRLTRNCLQVLLQCPTTRILLHTRSPLVLQDLELLKAFGPRLSVGISIPTDDDTVRQVVEPKAPPIPSRWVAAERLSAAGIAVGISVAPLMAVADPSTFARRARLSGAQSAWVGGLRLLKNDSFYSVLARHGWLHILDKAYQADVREAFREAMPAQSLARKRRVRGGEKPAAIPFPVALQPALFDGM